MQLYNHNFNGILAVAFIKLDTINLNYIQKINFINEITYYFFFMKFKIFFPNEI